MAKARIEIDYRDSFNLTGSSITIDTGVQSSTFTESAGPIMFVTFPLSDGGNPADYPFDQYSIDYYIQVKDT
ncbi:hypothetical protein HK103_001435 [Boothiomyces macroporosus]|uniref:Uncharacterized protein n=1 Tax=Boothiomyces macroporosus TaxID=261099 RepID=A0AAD5Y0V9_9FUNG|nr:hypothetical protein HK103_001435 [Boothiomyces macroporosus]